jgi:hypothetical protein
MIPTTTRGHYILSALAVLIVCAAGLVGALSLTAKPAGAEYLCSTATPCTYVVVAYDAAYKVAPIEQAAVVLAASESDAKAQVAASPNCAPTCSKSRRYTAWKVSPGTSPYTIGVSGMR